MKAGDQLSNPLVDFVTHAATPPLCWGSTLKPPGRLRIVCHHTGHKLGINSQTPW